MPTDVAKGQRRKAAIGRICAAATAITGSQEALELPARSQYGNDMLLIAQLETVAAYLESHQQVQKKQSVPKKAKTKNVVRRNPAKTKPVPTLLEKDTSNG